MMARWHSPDPSGLAAVNFSDPQSWNAYAYVGDTPLGATDPTGLMRSTDSNPYPPIGLPYFAGLSADPFPLADNTLFGFGNAGGPVMPPPGLLGQHGGDIALLPGPPLPDTLKLSPSGPACEQRILTDVNSQFQTNFSNGNVTREFPQGGGEDLQLEQSPFSGSIGQFNSIQPGRYPVHWWTYVIGWGANLHVTGETPSDPSAYFSDQNVGGALSVDFTAHIDSAWAYNPIGFMLHMVVDVWHLFGQRNPCP